MRENTPYLLHTKYMGPEERHNWWARQAKIDYIRFGGASGVLAKQDYGPELAVKVRATVCAARRDRERSDDEILLEWYNQSPTRLRGQGW